MLVGVEITKLINELERQKEKITNFLNALSRENDKDLYDHLYLINDFFDEAISSLRKLDEAIFLRSPFYEDLNDIERITTKLKDLVDHFFSQNNIVVERNGVEVFENQLLAQIEFYVYSLINYLNKIKSESIISDKIDGFSEKNKKLNEKIVELENVFEGWKNRDLYTIFEDDSEKFRKIARKYEISFYIALAFLFMYFFGWYVEIDTANFKFKFAEQFHENHTPTFYIQKISLLILSTTLAAFLLKRSFMNRRLADEAYRTAKELDALPRYMEGMPDEMKEKLRFDLAYKYFGNGIRHDSYTGGENLMHENIKANTDFILAVKDIAKPLADEK
ncbi:hypothetical protein KW868_00615 [Acinetobacter guillouiae]|uniref:Uncharacterized protein n=1 Tax=Acinetobacter guillouiae TaxID=106649 RepID=A0A8X8KFF3_ACIGI|nr:hypothetical protein [Acinetobacter guillouiae]MCF0262977.1 hypothetical protein [Acinetobacter guillouiae]